MNNENLEKTALCNEHNTRFARFFVVFVFFLNLTVVMALTSVSTWFKSNDRNICFCTNWK